MPDPIPQDIYSDPLMGPIGPPNPIPGAGAPQPTFNNASGFSANYPGGPTPQQLASAGPVGGSPDLPMTPQQAQAMSSLYMPPGASLVGPGAMAQGAASPSAWSRVFNSLGTLGSGLAAAGKGFAGSGGAQAANDHSNKAAKPWAPTDLTPEQLEMVRQHLAGQGGGAPVAPTQPSVQPAQTMAPASPSPQPPNVGFPPKPMGT